MRRAGLVVYVTGLLPDRGSKKCYSSTGTLGDATEVPCIRALSGTHTPRGCVRWMWNDQTGGTNRFLMRRADWSSMSPACCQTEAPRRVIRVRGRHRGPIRALSGTHTPGGCVRWMWNDQTGGTNRFLMRRADWSSMSPRPAARHRGSKTCYSSTGTPQRSHPCIERYPHSRRVCVVDVERSDRRYQPIPDA